MLVTVRPSASDKRNSIVIFSLIHFHSRWPTVSVSNVNESCPGEWMGLKPWKSKREKRSAFGFDIISVAHLWMTQRANVRKPFSSPRKKKKKVEKPRWLSKGWNGIHPWKRTSRAWSTSDTCLRPFTADSVGSLNEGLKRNKRIYKCVYT